MAENGQVTISNLKASTGINDDRLSAHHPLGTGNEIQMSDFFIVGFDYTDENSNGYPNLYEGDINTPIYPGDTIDIFLPNPTWDGYGPNDDGPGGSSDYPGNKSIVASDGVYGQVQQMGTLSGPISLSGNYDKITLQNISLGIPDSSDATMFRLRFTADEVNDGYLVQLFVEWNDPGYNADTEGLSTNNPITWRTSFAVNVPPISVTTKNYNRQSSTMDFDYVIEDADTGTGDIDVEISRRERRKFVDCTTDTWSSWTTIHTTTQPSDGTYHFQDTGLDDNTCPGTEYEWEVWVKDSSNRTDTAGVAAY